LSEVKNTDVEAARGDSRWYPVYLAVIVVTALVIAALWVFSRAYSS
jgi:hypothetical protein